MLQYMKGICLESLCWSSMLLRSVFKEKMIFIVTRLEKMALHTFYLSQSRRTETILEITTELYKVTTIEHRT